MGRYATTDIGEVKLSGVLSIATGFIIGSYRARDSVVSLTRAEVERVVINMEHMGDNCLAKPTDKYSVFTTIVNVDTRNWYLSHLENGNWKIAELRNWLRSEEERLVFA